MKLNLTSILWLLAFSAVAAERVKTEITTVTPVQFEKRGTNYFADFGEDAYGSMRIDISRDGSVA